MNWLRRQAPNPASTASGVSAADDQAYRYGAELLAQARDELNRADSKASILLAAVGVALGAVTSGIVASGWSPSRLPTTLTVVWWIGTAIVAGGVAALLAAVYPRRRRRAVRSGRRPGDIAYYADVAAFQSAHEVTSAIRRSADHDLELLAEQLLHVSQIAGRKYRLVGWGIWLVAVGVVCALTTFLVSSSGA